MTETQSALSIIVLAYNDAPALPALVEEMTRALKPRFPEYEIVIVNDGSADDTLETARKLAETYGEVRVISHDQNQGVGKAFQSGVRAARFDIIGFIDGDGQYSPADFPKLFECLQHADAALGVRVRRQDPHGRSIVSRFFNTLLAWRFGLKTRDTNAGIKIYRRKVLEKIQPLLSNAAFFNAEILIKAQAAGFILQECPVDHRARTFGQARGLCWANVAEVLRGIFCRDMRPYARNRS